jgi:DNA-binding transcriptional LysR family regulator
MHYTLHQLQIFLKIAQTKSITKAAVELNLTQPAVSIQLKKLQEQFDIPLTEVIGRQLYITHFGAEIAITAYNPLLLGIKLCVLSVIVDPSYDQA